jgi:DNA-binding MarR family transcriptional regulator
MDRGRDDVGTKTRQKQPRRGPADTDARSLIEPLAGQVGFVLRRVQTAVFADFIESLSGVDLRPAQYALLEIVRARPGLKQSEAASALGIQKTNFVSLVSTLEERALLRRRRSRADRRSYGLYLEPDGNLLLKRARAFHDDQELRLAARLGANGRDQLLDLLQRLARAESRR